MGMAVVAIVCRALDACQESRDGFTTVGARWKRLDVGGLIYTLFRRGMTVDAKHSKAT